MKKSSQKKKMKKAGKKAGVKVKSAAQKPLVRLQPLGDKIVVRPQALEEKKTSFGLIIPETANKEKPDTGKVVAVGEGRMNENGIRTKMSVKIGDMVLFAKYVPDEIKLDGEDLVILREDQILGIIG
jgi:chaperonin GroES